jgi:hypothetical protein
MNTLPANPENFNSVFTPEQQEAFENLARAMRYFNENALNGCPTIKDSENLEASMYRVIALLSGVSDNRHVKAMALKAFADALRLANLEFLNVSRTSEDSPLFGGIAHV